MCAPPADDQEMSQSALIANLNARDHLKALNERLEAEARDAAYGSILRQAAYLGHSRV